MSHIKQYTIPRIPGDWRMRKGLKPGSLFLPAINREPGYKAMVNGPWLAYCIYIERAWVERAKYMHLSI